MESSIPYSSPHLVPSSIFPTISTFSLTVNITSNIPFTFFTYIYVLRAFSCVSCSPAPCSSSCFKSMFYILAAPSVVYPAAAHIWGIVCAVWKYHLQAFEPQDWRKPCFSSILRLFPSSTPLFHLPSSQLPFFFFSFSAFPLFSPLPYLSKFNMSLKQCTIRMQ